MARGRPSWIPWLFGNRETGRITIVSLPNASLWIFIIASILHRVVQPGGDAGAVLGAAATGALLVWGADEVASGVNPFRRLLGGAIVIWEVVSLIRP